MFLSLDKIPLKNYSITCCIRFLFLQLQIIPSNSELDRTDLLSCSSAGQKTVLGLIQSAIRAAFLSEGFGGDLFRLLADLSSLWVQNLAGSTSPSQLQLVMAGQVVLTSSLSNLHLLRPCFHHHAIILRPSQTLITQHNFTFSTPIS